MKFSSDEEDDQDGHLIKNAAQYLSYRPPETNKKGANKNDVNQSKYFDFIQNKHPPKIARYNKKWQKQEKFHEKAILMTGKNSIKNKDDNEEDEWPPIIGPIYNLRMK